jgi:septal ring factor EnvC (AmiA/AmiB activator)
VSERERQLQREFEEKERELQEARVQVATQLGDAEQKGATLRDALDATQSELFDMKAKYVVTEAHSASANVFGPPCITMCCTTMC